VNEIREKLSREARKNRFEVSLGQIPPELETKLWERLRQELGTQVMEQTKEQSAEAFASAKAAIDLKINEALAEFRHRLSGELHTVEQRAKALTEEITIAAQHQVRLGVQQLQRQSLETRTHLTSHGEELAGSLERRLVESHDVHRREVERTLADGAAKASQLQNEVTDLGRSMGALNESVRRLEAELDGHLQQLASGIISDTRAELENALAVAVKELQARTVHEAERQVDEVCSHLRTIQNRIEKSFAGSLKAQGEEMAQAAEQQIENIAQQSVDRWRVALAKDLNSVAKTLGQELRQELELEESQDKVPITG
jgi:hypothetical protein